MHIVKYEDGEETSWCGAQTVLLLSVKEAGKATVTGEHDVCHECLEKLLSYTVDDQTPPDDSDELQHAMVNEEWSRAKHALVVCGIWLLITIWVVFLMALCMGLLTGCTTHSGASPDLFPDCSGEDCSILQ